MEGEFTWIYSRLDSLIDKALTTLTAKVSYPPFTRWPRRIRKITWGPHGTCGVSGLPCTCLQALGTQLPPTWAGTVQAECHAECWRFHGFSRQKYDAWKYEHWINKWDLANEYQWIIDLDRFSGSKVWVWGKITKNRSNNGQLLFQCRQRTITSHLQSGLEWTSWYRMVHELPLVPNVLRCFKGIFLKIIKKHEEPSVFQHATRCRVSSRCSWHDNTWHGGALLWGWVEGLASCRKWVNDCRWVILPVELSLIVDG